MPAEPSIAVVGTGPTGMVCALCIAASGLDVTLVGPPPPKTGRHADRRTAALFTGSVHLLRNIGIWSAIEEACAPVAGIRLIEDRGALLSAPEIVFTADEVALDVFGWNVPNAALTQALWSTISSQAPAAQRQGTVLIVTQTVERLEIDDPQVTLHLSNGDTQKAAVVVGADGRNSMCRQAAGIVCSSRTYPQQALTCTFEHARPHHAISTEFHRNSGPLTVVPLPGQASSLVWVETPSEVERLKKLDDAAFLQELEVRLQGLLGELSALTPRNTFPLASLEAKTFAANRIALVGEAAHVLPPIGAQGLNLGLRDCAVLADCLAKISPTRGRHCDPGHSTILNSYDRQRRADVKPRLAGIDLLNQSLITDLLPAHLARGLGLHIVRNLPPLRRLLINEGLHPHAVQPTLMQENAGYTLQQKAPRHPA